jgi:hypothetical protein
MSPHSRNTLPSTNPQIIAVTSQHSAKVIYQYLTKRKCTIAPTAMSTSYARKSATVKLLIRNNGTAEEIARTSNLLLIESQSHP